jgi:predicted ester cyclase
MAALVHVGLRKQGVDRPRLLSEGDKAVARCSGLATYKGGLLDIPSKDQRVFETSILIIRVEDGLVREIWSEMSDLQIVMQLGAFPAPDQGR